MKTFEEIRKQLAQQAQTEKQVLVCAGLSDQHGIESLLILAHEGVITPIFVGDKDKISQSLANLGRTEDEFEILSTRSEEETSQKAVSLIRQGRGDVLMKGNLQTKNLLKAVVNHDTGIRKSHLLSHLAVFEIPSYHKLLFISDGGMIERPDFSQKQGILFNSLQAMRGLALPEIKVGVLTESETLNPKSQASQDAYDLKRMAEGDAQRDYLIEGPISFDLAVSKRKADLKNYTSPVAGDVDLLIVPEIVTGNAIGKSILEFAGGKMAGLIIGAQVPIVLTSRGASTEEKMNSLALALALK